MSACFIQNMCSLISRLFGLPFRMSFRRLESGKKAPAEFNKLSAVPQVPSHFCMTPLEPAPVPNRASSTARWRLRSSQVNLNSTASKWDSTSMVQSLVEDCVQLDRVSATICSSNMQIIRRLNTSSAARDLIGTDCLETPHLRVRLYESGTSVRDIALEKIKFQIEPDREDPDDPFIIYDLGDVVAKDNQWKKLLPNVETFYAVKCNPKPELIRLLLGLGRGFDCASKKEIQLVLEQGGSPDRIIYAHPCKQESHLRFAREKGVRLMTFDTEEELHKIKRVYPEAQLVLRVRYDDLTAACKLGSKFGCHDGDVRPLMQRAKTLGLDIVGISFHVGSESRNPRIIGEAIRHIRPMFDAGTALGFNMKLLDIGGGFPGGLHPHPQASFDRFANTVQEALEETFPPSCGVRVIAEPGTFYTQSAGYMVANIIAKRAFKTHITDKRENKTEPSILMYYLNVGMYNGFISRVMDPEFFKLPQPLDQEANALTAQNSDKIRVLRKSSIWGPTCDSIDFIFSSCLMPEMEAGQFVLFHDMGSYVAPCASDFNGYGLPPACFIAPKEMRSDLERIFSP